MKHHCAQQLRDAKQLLIALSSTERPLTRASAGLLNSTIRLQKIGSILAHQISHVHGQHCLSKNSIPHGYFSWRAIRTIWPASLLESPEHESAVDLPQQPASSEKPWHSAQAPHTVAFGGAAPHGLPLCSQSRSSRRSTRRFRAVAIPPRE